jgi:hypothetical protein
MSFNPGLSGWHPGGGGLGTDAEVADPTAVTLTLAVNSDSSTSADSGGPRPKLILKRTGADGDSDPTPSHAPIGDIEWETVHTDGTHYTVARIWVDEESTDSVVNVGKMRIGVHDGDATTYGDVDLSGGNLAVTGRDVAAFQSTSSGGRTIVRSTHAVGSVEIMATTIKLIKPPGFPEDSVQLDISAVTDVRSVAFPDVSGSVGIRVAVPASASATGVAGTWAADASHFYYCSSTNTWVRAPLATW